MNPQVEIGIAHIFVRDISFESPDPLTFLRSATRPQIRLDARVGVKVVQESLFEVRLELTVEAKTDDKVVFIVEVEQCGLFEVRNASQDQLEHVLNVFCPTTLFPYARQAVDQALNHGGFQPLMLAPINFESLRSSTGTGAHSPVQQ